MMTMFSHLITPENQTEYRYMAGLIVLTWAALVLACREVFGLALAGRRALGHRETVVALALLGVIGAGTLLARQNIEHRMRARSRSGSPSRSCPTRLG